jgi:hypothetical protein
VHPQSSLITKGLSLLRNVHLLFKHKDEPKKKLQVDLGDLQSEKENLINYIQTHLKVTVYQVKDKLAVDSEKVTQTDLLQTVKKFVYHRDLNVTHYVSLEPSTIKINRFKGHEKKKDKHKKESPHQTASQTWGL